MKGIKDHNAHGRDMAKQRYGAAKPVAGGHGWASTMPQDIEDKHDTCYDNDVPDDYLRGMGKGEAEGKPDFDKSNAWRDGKLRED